MGKFDFYNSIIDNLDFIDTFSKSIKKQLDILYFGDLNNSIKLFKKFGYKIDIEYIFDYVDLEKLKNIKATMVKIKDKQLKITLNRNINDNINRYLFFKAMSYDFLDYLVIDEEVNINLVSRDNNSILAERLAIDLVISKHQYICYKEGMFLPDAYEASKFLTPELKLIREDKLTPKLTFKDIEKYEKEEKCSVC